MPGHEEQSRSDTRIYHHGRPSLRDRFVQPVVLKQGSMFLLCDKDGDIEPRSEQGLYFHDMRYLSKQQLMVNGGTMISLLADAGQGQQAVFELTNHDFHGHNGEVVLGKESLGIRRVKTLGDEYSEEITVQNFTRDSVRVSVHLEYEADFADMFVVRGAEQEKRGTLHDPAWQGQELIFRYDGADSHLRVSHLRFSPAPAQREGGRVSFHLDLGPRQSWQLAVVCELRDECAELETRPLASEGSGHREREQARGGALGPGARIETDNPLFDAVLTRSFVDLHMLRMRQKGDVFVAAGVPWYVALFGRDSLVTALQMLPLEPDIAANTLRVLALRQGTKVDDWRDEQPGKILHELRVDEMANLDEIPQTPYYGSVDSTLLFLVLIGAHALWTGSLDLFHELKQNVEAALTWMDEHGDNDGDGLFDYLTRSPKGLRNQGWKDSGNGIVMEDGSLAEPPIALPEVQGNAYLAWLLVAGLYQRDGDASRAEALRGKAEDLYKRFNDAFWLPDARYYAFCKQAGGRFSRSVASNPAHALWTGIVDPARALDVAQRVLQPDMFSGWGVRTLSAEDASYNPVDYQVGSIWPHDNAFIVAGMHRYGLGEQANTVFKAVMEAAVHFELFRLPETFAGYPRGEASRPVEYPVACNPQAWAAASLPYMLLSSLGLEPDAFERRLVIRRPCLPEWLNRVCVKGMRVGDAHLDLEYRRIGDSTIARVLRRDGDIKVLLEEA